MAPTLGVCPVEYPCACALPNHSSAFPHQVTSRRDATYQVHWPQGKESGMSPKAKGRGRPRRRPPADPRCVPPPPLQPPPLPPPPLLPQPPRRLLRLDGRDLAEQRLALVEQRGGLAAQGGGLGPQLGLLPLERRLEGLQMALGRSRLIEVPLLGLLQEGEALLVGLDLGDQLAELLAHGGRGAQLLHELGDALALDEAADHTGAARRVDHHHDLGELRLLAGEIGGVHLDCLGGLGQLEVELVDLRLHLLNLGLGGGHLLLDRGGLGVGGGLAALEPLELSCPARRTAAGAGRSSECRNRSAGRRAG